MWNDLVLAVISLLSMFNIFIEEASILFPFGRFLGVEELHEWIFPSKKNQEKVMGKEGGIEGTDNDFMEMSFENIGNHIIGGNAPWISRYCNP